LFELFLNAFVKLTVFGLIESDLLERFFSVMACEPSYYTFVKSTFWKASKLC